jgi:hypothetical protein
VTAARLGESHESVKVVNRTDGCCQPQDHGKYVFHVRFYLRPMSRYEGLRKKPISLFVGCMLTPAIEERKYFMRRTAIAAAQDPAEANQHLVNPTEQRLNPLL